MFASHVRPGRRGFTLLELLVVIAVLGILALILIPVVAKIRASAQSTHCVSNLTQIGRAFTLYAQEHRSCLPPPVDPANGNRPWYVAIHPYTGTPWRDDADVSQISPMFRCPTWELNSANAPAAGDIGYAMSAGIGPTVDPTRMVSLPNVPHPTRTVVVLELTGTTVPYFPAAGQAMSEFATGYLADFEEDGCDRHAGSGNYLFADGHVGHHTPSDAASFLK